MKINKIGHSCLVMEVDDVKILTDPGDYTTAQNNLVGVQAVLISHNHGDHLSTDSLKTILSQNPEASVYTNSNVGVDLDKANIPYTLVGHEQDFMVGSVSITAFEHEHNTIYPGVPVPINTSYLIGNKLFFPGDTWAFPNRPIELLALPTGGPWNKTMESISYAKRLQPKMVFPIHDFMFKDPENASNWQKRILTEAGIEFIFIPEGQTQEF